MSAAGFPAVDTAAAELFWSEYAAARPEAVRLCSDYTVERFGDSAALADGLLRAVTEGAKRATSELAEGDEIVFERFRVVRPPELADPAEGPPGPRLGAGLRLSAELLPGSP